MSTPRSRSKRGGAPHVPFDHIDPALTTSAKGLINKVIPALVDALPGVASHKIIRFVKTDVLFYENVSNRRVFVRFPREKYKLVCAVLMPSEQAAVMAHNNRTYLWESATIVIKRIRMFAALYLYIYEPEKLKTFKVGAESWSKGEKPASTKKRAKSKTPSPLLFEHKTVASRIQEFETAYGGIGITPEVIDDITPGYMKSYVLVMLVVKSLLADDDSFVSTNFGFMKDLIQSSTSMRLLEAAAHVIIEEYHKHADGTVSSGDSDDEMTSDRAGDDDDDDDDDDGGGGGGGGGSGAGDGGGSGGGGAGNVDVDVDGSGSGAGDLVRAVIAMTK